MNEKQIGQHCPDCGTPYVAGKTGAYCKACYIKWANQNKPQGSYNAPQASKTNETPQSIDLHQFITKTEYNAILDRQRAVFTKMQDQINEMGKQIEYFKELWKTQNPTAFVVHEDQIPVVGMENFKQDASNILGIK